MATVVELTQQLSAQANAVRTSVGTSRYTGAVDRLHATLNTVAGILERGRPSNLSASEWTALQEMYQRASYTIRAEGVGASIEDWSDIIIARLRSARATPNQTTIGALMEAVDRASQVDASRAEALARDELEDTITAAREAIRELSQGGTAPVGTTKAPSGEITGTYHNTALTSVRNFLWPTDKPLYLRPGFLLGSAVGIGALASWQKKNLRKAVKKLKK